MKNIQNLYEHQVFSVRVLKKDSTFETRRDESLVLCCLIYSFIFDLHLIERKIIKVNGMQVQQNLEKMKQKNELLININYFSRAERFEDNVLSTLKEASVLSYNYKGIRLKCIVNLCFV